MTFHEQAMLGRDDGRDESRSVAAAMRLLQNKAVACAVEGCPRLASHVRQRDDRLVCADHQHVGGGTLTIEAARAKLQKAMSK
jgi:hypothetical protein